MAEQQTEPRPKRIAVAVQGGGAHGAFSWGALDGLLDRVSKGELVITALSGTSAGGFNAALCAFALGAGGAQAAHASRARELLEDYWMADADVARFNPYSATAQIWRRTFGTWNIDDSPASLLASVNNQVFSPAFYLQHDWLAQVLGDKIDFEALHRQSDPPGLYITATNITTGRRDIFAKSAVTLEVLKASASIPQVFLPARYRGNYYWDGGFMGNPALSPLITDATDVVIIQLNPFSRDEPPLSAMQINNRVNEITFNSSLVHEINAIVAVNKMIDYFTNLAKENDAAKQALKLLPASRINLYRITDEPYLRTLGYASKAVIVKEFLRELHDKGKEAADKWWNQAHPSLGDTAPHHPAIPETGASKDQFPGDVLDTLLSRKHIIIK